MLKIIFLLILLLSPFLTFSAENNKPNILIILVDDLGYMDVGVFYEKSSGIPTSKQFYETPNIDQMAKEGVMFSSAYSAGSVCSPTRASLVTGKYPARLHLTSYIPGNERPFEKLSRISWTKYLKMSETTYSEVLKDAGYSTFYAGKWHLGQLSPDNHGFEEVIENQSWYSPPEDPKHVKKYTDATIKFIKKHRKSPFLAVLSHNTVHVPLEERDSLIKKYSNKMPAKNGQNNPVMAAMIETLDKSTGKLLKKIKELNLEDETYIIFLSDNGGLMKVDNQIATSNLPLRGGKSQFYEGGIRIPFIIKGPGVSKNKIIDYPVISNDLFPTMLDMVGLPPLPNQHLDGISLRSLLIGQKNRLIDRDLFWHHPHYQSMAPHGAIRSGPWKLIEHYEDKRIELFNLQKDMVEQNNLAEKKPKLAEKMREKLHDHLENVNAQIPVKNPAYDSKKTGRQFRKRGKYDDGEFKQQEYLKEKDSTNFN